MTTGPQHTGPTYEGRPLPRPGEELVDHGLGFDVATLLSRRRPLGVFGVGAATLGLAACGGDGGSATASASTSSSGASSAVGGNSTNAIATSQAATRRRWRTCPASA